MNNKRKSIFLLGIIANGLYMIGDWLIDAFGPGNVEVGILGASNWTSMPMWRFELSIILGAIASVLVIPAMREWMKLADEVRDRNSKMGLWMSRIFQGGLWAGIVSCFFIHTMCCLVAVIFKNIYAVYGNAEEAFQILDNIGMSFLVPFFIFYFVMELATAIGYIYMVVKKRLALRWPAILCCSFCTLMMIELLNLTGNWIIHDIVTAGESFGWVLMMAMGILHTKRTMAK